MNELGISGATVSTFQAYGSDFFKEQLIAKPIHGVSMG